MTIRTFFFRSAATCALILLALACAPVCAQSGTVEDIVNAFPAPDSDRQHVLTKQLVALGPDALAQVCDMIEQAGGDDTSARYALNAVGVYVMQPGREQERRRLERVLIDILKRQPDPTVQVFLLERLARIGTAESLPALMPFLSDETLCSHTLRTLEAIEAPGTADRLVEVLPGLSVASRPLVLTTLGNLQATGHTPALARWLKGDNAATHAAARYALAASGEPEAYKLLLDELRADRPDRHEAFDSCLLYARRLAAHDREQAESLLQTLLTAGDYNPPVQVRTAALTALVESGLLADPADLLRWTTQTDLPQLRAAALQCAEAFSGPDATRIWCRALPDAAPAVRVDILRMLARRGDPVAFAAARDQLVDDDPSVRKAAIDATARLGGARAVSVLVERLAEAPESERPALKAALLTLPTDPVVQKVGAFLPQADAPVQVALLEILAQRHQTADFEILFDLARSGARPVRRQAFQTLGAVVYLPQLDRLARLVAATDERFLQAAGQQALVAAVRRLPDRTAVAERILTALDQAAPAGQTALLPVLPVVATESALEALVRHATNRDESAAQAALASLARWPDARAARHQLDLAAAETTPARARINLLRSCIQTLRQADAEPAEKLPLYRRALTVAARPEAKQLTVAALSDLDCVEALLLAGDCLDDSEAATRQAAADAIAQLIAADEVDLTTAPADRVRAILADAQPLIADPEKAAALDRAMRQLETRPLNALTDQEKALGFTLLFNGADLTGWHRHEHLPGHGVAGKWTVENHAIVGRQDPPGQGGIPDHNRNLP